MPPYTRSVAELTKDDVQSCGGKATSLGELTRMGARVPPGFCITAPALVHVIEAGGLQDRIAEVAARLDIEDLNALDAETERIRDMIIGAPIPEDLEAEILSGYGALVSPENRFVAVRSSVAIKDSPISSFPGLMDTYHYVLGEPEVLARVRECWASLWNTRAAFARLRQQIAHERGVIAPVVQLMVNADCAGVAFTANPVSGAPDEIIVESNWGIGESVVSGRSLNDFHVLDKATLAVKVRKIVRKNVMVTMDDDRGSGRVERDVPPDRASEATLSEEQLAELGRIARRIEEHFGFNVDVEWAYQDGRLYVLQARRIRHAPTPAGGASS